MSALPESLTIRAANEDDLPSILVLLDQLTDAMEAPIVAVPERVADHVRHFLQTAGHGVFLAEHASNVVGLISVQVRQTLLEPEPVALIDELVVADSTRGQGIGRRLVDQVVCFANQHGCSELEVSTERANTAAQAFYRDCGFDEEHVLLEMGLTADEAEETERGQA